VIFNQRVFKGFETSRCQAIYGSAKFNLHRAPPLRLLRRASRVRTSVFRRRREVGFQLGCYRRGFRRRRRLALTRQRGFVRRRRFLFRLSIPFQSLLMMSLGKKRRGRGGYLPRGLVRARDLHEGVGGARGGGARELALDGSGINVVVAVVVAAARKKKVRDGIYWV
jgi:hypothetical protein